MRSTFVAGLVTISVAGQIKMQTASSIWESARAELIAEAELITALRDRSRVDEAGTLLPGGNPVSNETAETNRSHRPQRSADSIAGGP